MTYMTHLPKHRDTDTPCVRAMTTRDCPRQHNYKRVTWHGAPVQSIEYTGRPDEGTVIVTLEDWTGGRALLANLEFSS